MLRVQLNLEDQSDLNTAKARWKFAPGLVPGEDNQGLLEGLPSSPARLREYDDSTWDVCDNIQIGRSAGLTFGWFRINLTIPTQVAGRDITGYRLFFETCIDDYGEIWVNGECDRVNGTVAGFNIPQRVPVAAEAIPGQNYVLACLAANGPLAAPGGGIFMRYATLAFENYSL